VLVQPRTTHQSTVLVLKSAALVEPTTAAQELLAGIAMHNDSNKNARFMFLTVFLRVPSESTVHPMKWDPIVLIVGRACPLLFDLDQAGHFASTVVYFHNERSRRLR
jgi:hypothetical protein